MGQIKNKQQDDRLKFNHIKTRCYWHKNRLTSTEIDTYISSNDFQQDCQDTREGTVFSTNGVVEQLVEKSQPLPHTRHENELKKDHKLKPKS